ncbi:UNVERIFIED_CONTAM: hypothetical protein FKN15_042113 [Acipenser sinensis]
MTSTVSWKRVIRKVKMGKKVEKVLKERVEKGGGAASSSAEEEASRSAEEYVCTGILETDFPELCALVGMKEIPAVTSRPRPPATPTAEKNMLEERQSLSTPPPGSAPAGERFTYFRPRLQVELESEDPRTVREVQVKGESERCASAPLCRVSLWLYLPVPLSLSLSLCLPVSLRPPPSLSHMSPCPRRVEDR